MSKEKTVMLNSIQHLTKSRTDEILKQVQDDKTGLFTGPSSIGKVQMEIAEVKISHVELWLSFDI